MTVDLGGTDGTKDFKHFFEFVPDFLQKMDFVTVCHRRIILLFLSRTVS
jgi:hypothetical protein